MIEITSYGVLHHDQPAGDAYDVDLTEALRNPADDPALIRMTGLDAPVREHVLSTPGAAAVVSRTTAVAEALLAVDGGEPVRVRVRCRGGRHRSVAVAEAVAARLRGRGHQVAVEHRHIRLDVVQPAA